MAGVATPGRCNDGLWDWRKFQSCFLKRREREREDERMHVSLVSDEDFTSDFRCFKSPTAIATVLRLGLMRVEKNISFKGA